MQYFVIEIRVKTSKRQKGKLAIVEGEDKDTVDEAFYSVRARLPILEKDTAFIHKIWDIKNKEEYIDLFSVHSDSIIFFKICRNVVNRYFLADTFVRVMDMNFHECSVSAIHIQSKRSIMRDKTIEEKFSVVNEKVRTLLVEYDTTFSVFETSILWEWDDVTSNMWETIFKKNDIAIIFHDVNIDTIVGISKILYPLSEKYTKMLRLFFVDADNELYDIDIGEQLIIRPTETSRYII